MRLQVRWRAFFAEKMSLIVRYGFINGLPGFVTIEQGDTLQTTALEIEDGKVFGHLCHAQSRQAAASRWWCHSLMR